MARKPRVGWWRTWVAVGAAGWVVLGSSCAHTGGAGGAEEPAPSLSGTTWRFYDIGRDTLADASKTELRIDPDGKVSGSTGCNRFTGTATIAGTNLTFSPLATTRMACEPGLMRQESGILAALQSVKSFAFVKDGRLNLLDAGGGPVARLVGAKP